MRPIARPVLAGAAVLFGAAALGAQPYYGDWQADHFRHDERTGVGAPAADPDGDGVPNVLEFGAGTDPWRPHGGGRVRVLDDGGGWWDAALPWRDGVFGVSLGLEATSDLATWTTVPGAPIVGGGFARWSLPEGDRTTVRARAAVTENAGFLGRRVRYEAEDGARGNASISNEFGGFSGVGYVDGADALGAYVEWVVFAETAGFRPLVFRSANGSGSARPHQLSVNGTNVSTVSLPATASWSTWAETLVNVNLAAGRNLVRLTATSAAGPSNLDAVDVYGEPGPALLQLGVAAVGDGTIAIEPAPVNGFLPRNTRVRLRAIPGAASTWAGWSGTLAGAPPETTFALKADTLVTGTFLGGTGPSFEPVGFATLGAGLTGGAGGPTVTVTNLTDLRTQAGRSDPVIIRVQGTITGSGTVVVRSHKTILGLPGATLDGIGLRIGQGGTSYGQIRNIIVRNLTIRNVRAGSGDAISILDGARNVWIDHCELHSDRNNGIDYYDGLIDITNGAELVTISWCVLRDHYKTMLYGNSDDNAAEDAGKLTVTLHHNHLLRTDGRNPSVRFGTVHAYNNLYEDNGDYGVALRMGAQGRVEYNVFRNVPRPIRADTSLSPVAGQVVGAETNLYLNSGSNSISLAPSTWVAPYAYPLTPAEQVETLVRTFAGVGVIPVE